MKHIAQIQKEFVKKAMIDIKKWREMSKWENFSRQKQLEYLRHHPRSKRHLTADLIDATRKTKTDYMNNMSKWIESEEEHSKLAEIEMNFMKQYLPENFYVRDFDSEIDGMLPSDLYDRLVEKYGLRTMLDEESGDEPEEDMAVIDEKSETVTPQISGGEYFKIKLATGIYNGKRMIVSDFERYGLANAYDKDGNVTSQKPYDGSGVSIIMEDKSKDKDSSYDSFVRGRQDASQMAITSLEYARELAAMRLKRVGYAEDSKEAKAFLAVFMSKAKDSINETNKLLGE